MNTSETLSGVRRTRRRWLGVGGAAVIVLVASLATIVSIRSTDESGSSVDLGAADDLAVGGVRWHAGHLLYLARTDAAVMAFSQRSPEQGCRLALVADVDVEFPEPFRRDGAVFADFCFGAVFALDGTHLAGPSPRDLDQYAVEVRDGRITVDTTRILTAP